MVVCSEDQLKLAEVEFYGFSLLPLTLLIPLTIKQFMFEWLLYLFITILQSKIQIHTNLFFECLLHLKLRDECSKKFKDSVEIRTVILSFFSLV